MSDDKQGYYRLTVDLQKETISAEYLGTTGVDGLAADGTDVKVYQKAGTVVLSADKAIDAASLVDLSGNVLDSKGGQSLMALGRNLNKGVYILTFRTGTDVNTKKIVVK